MEWLILFLVILMLGAAVLIFLLDSFLAALAAFSVVSLVLSVLFVLLRAPDVAMTEVAVGAALASLFFALTIRRLGLWHSAGDKSS
jgi:uncharacterized MnhB-related membrane protein